MFLRFLSCLPCGRKSLRTSPLALFLMLLACLPRSHRSLLRMTTLFLSSWQLHHPPVVQLLTLVSLKQNPIPQFPLGIGRPCGTILVPLCGASPCSCKLTLAIWCNFIINKTFVLFFYHCVKVTQFSDTSLKKYNWSLLLWCTCPLKNSRGP